MKQRTTHHFVFRLSQMQKYMVGTMNLLLKWIIQNTQLKMKMWTIIMKRKPLSENAKWPNDNRTVNIFQG